MAKKWSVSESVPPDTGFLTPEETVPAEDDEEEEEEEGEEGSEPGGRLYV